MKVSEALRRRYKAKERDFRSYNLRGQSLKGQNFSDTDFSKADFSETDIRGVNFSNAILKDANFAGAKAGVAKQWVIIQLILSFLLSAFLNFVVGYFNSVNLGIYFQPQITKGDLGITPAVFALFVVFTTFWAVVQQGLRVKTVRTIAIATLIAIIVGSFDTAARLVIDKGATVNDANDAVVLALAVVLRAFVSFPIYAATFALSGANTAMFAIATAVTVATVVTGTGLSIIAVMIVITGAVAGTISIGYFTLITNSANFAVPITSIVAGMIVIMLFSFYLAWQAIHGNEKFAFIHKFGIVFGALGGTSFCGADLTGANFKNAILKGTNFISFQQPETNFNKVCWESVKGLDRARVGDSNLSNPAVRELLITRNGSNNPNNPYVKADLRGTNLNGVNLKGANLKWADLSGATLRNADLSKANLTETLVLGTKLNGATLTDACIEAWNIDNETKLDNVKCEFVYLKESVYLKGNKKERRQFAPGEFTALFQKALNTVDLIFKDGVDWKAFFLSFQKLRDEYGDENLAIQAIEKKTGGAFVIRLEVPLEAEKAVIERRAKELYERDRQILEAQYRVELNAKEIESYKRENTNMTEIVKLLAANKSITIEAKAVAENQSKSETYNNNLSGANISSFANRVQDNAQVQANQYNYAPEKQQTLFEAAAEIQQLLNQLSSTYPANTSTEQIAIATKAVEEIEKNPVFKQRTIGALKAGGTEALKELIKHPAVNILLAAIEGWQTAE